MRNTDTSYSRWKIPDGSVLYALLLTCVLVSGCRSYSPGIQKNSQGEKLTSQAIQTALRPGDRAAFVMATTRNETAEAGMRWAAGIASANASSMVLATSAASGAGMDALADTARAVGNMNQQVGVEMQNRLREGGLVSIVAPRKPTWEQDDYYLYSLCPAMLAEMESVFKNNNRFSYVGINEVQNRAVLEKPPGPSFVAEVEGFILTNKLNATIRLHMLHSVRLGFTPKAVLVCCWEVRPINGSPEFVIQTVNRVATKRVEPSDVRSRSFMLELARQAATDFVAILGGNPPVHGDSTFYPH